MLQSSVLSCVVCICLYDEKNRNKLINDEEDDNHTALLSSKLFDQSKLPQKTELPKSNW